MSATLTVLLNDMIAGTVSRLHGGRLIFEYDDNYRQHLDATPLSASMPVQIRSHQDHLITPWLWNLLPDNEAVIDRWARQFQVSSSSPFSLLATPIGQDCAGAVSFVKPEDLEQEINRTGSITWLTGDEIAQRIKDLKHDSTSWLGKTFSGQFSLAGAQAKTALVYRDGRWGVPHGSIPTTHILKPAISGFTDHELNEHLCLKAARLAGLTVVDSQVKKFDNESAIVVARYDRAELDGHTFRLHQEDLCQALGVPPTGKYQRDGGPGPADIVSLFRRTMSPENSDQAISRFIDALAWNWLIGGTDAHAKNYSIFLDNRDLRFAPLYDIASSLPYDMHERKLKLAIKIGKRYDMTLTQSSWPDAARLMGLKEDSVLSRVRELASHAPDAFAEAAKTDRSELDSKLPSLLVDLVGERARRCLRALDGPRPRAG